MRFLTYVSGSMLRFTDAVLKKTVAGGMLEMQRRSHVMFGTTTEHGLRKPTIPRWAADVMSALQSLLVKIA